VETLAIIFGFISGGCLLAIQLRKKLPLFGGIVSPKMHENIDSTDKKLAIFALIAFMVCMAFLLASF